MREDDEGLRIGAVPLEFGRVDCERLEMQRRLERLLLEDTPLCSERLP